MLRCRARSCRPRSWHETDLLQQSLISATGSERIRRRLGSTDDGNRQMVDILNAVLTDGLPAVEAACAEALGHGVHSADVVLNILARQREPAPPANYRIARPLDPSLRYRRDRQR